MGRVIRIKLKLAMTNKQILGFIFEKVIEEIDYGGLKDCDNANVLRDLLASGLIDEEQHRKIVSCKTLCDKNR